MLLRLRGWMLLHQKKLNEARAAFEKLGANDPLAQLGLARIFLEQDDKAAAAGYVRQSRWPLPSIMLLSDHESSSFSPSCAAPNGLQLGAANFRTLLLEFRQLKVAQQWQAAKFDQKLRNGHC